jgi:hypothetical protein
VVAAAEQAAVDQARPLGIAQGPWPIKGQPVGRPRSTAPRTIRALSLLAAQRSPARPLPAPPAPGAALHLDWWLKWACRCRIPAFVKLSRTIRINHDRILAAVELGLSNSKLVGLNSKIRLLNHRGYGHHSAAALISMIYLCCGGITVQLPTER